MKSAAPNPIAANTGVAIELRRVSREFPGGVRALDAIDLQIRAGEFVALLGPSGCGKSTLLRLIAGLDQPTAGTISVPATRVAYVFQDAHLLPWRNVLRNVALPLELSGVAKDERLDRARNAIAQVGLSDALSRYPAQLSGGMRMRVSLARALITEPALLLLDEPFAALDEITRQSLDEQLRSLWLTRAMTTIFVTHSTSESVFLADRAIVFSPRPGRIIADVDLAAHLPRERNATLRGESVFAQQSRVLFEALRNGGGTA